MENDCAYTSMIVHKQTRNKNTAVHNKPFFISNLSNTQHLVLLLNDSILFAYNGQFITYMQADRPSMNSNNNLFFNISSYGNENIFNHLRRIFEQEMNNKTWFTVKSLNYLCLLYVLWLNYIILLKSYVKIFN